VTFSNIAHQLTATAAERPGQPAIKIPRGRSGEEIDYLTLSFRELELEVAAWRARLERKGVHPGDRVLVMVRPGLPLIAAAFALFQMGAVPVIIDPGMGRKQFLACVERSKPRVLLGIPLAQVMSYVSRSAFASVAIRAWVSGNPTARLSVSSEIVNRKSEIVYSHATDLAAVLFTSGSTGAPKGVCYEHGMFAAQVRLVRDAYAIAPGEVDLPLLPIFALFNPALGMTTVVPELDPSRPAAMDPEKIVQAIQQENVTNSFGSPTLWRKIFDHCLAQKITLPSLRRVLCAGAPVPASLWEDAMRVLPNGRLHSPYGATEALPIATVASDEVLAARKSGDGPGALVGAPLARNRVKIIAPVNGAIATLAQTRELARGEIGEILVTGPSVTKSYDALPLATAFAKIAGAHPDGTPVTWHRMGDAGSLDEAGRLWFCGRLAERVVTAARTLHTEPCEQVFRGHPRVARCALIGLGEPGTQEPALVVQLAPNYLGELAALAAELRALAKSSPATRDIRRFFFHSDFPVDVRHNAKIHRLTLAHWASTQPGYLID